MVTEQFASHDRYLYSSTTKKYLQLSNIPLDDDLLFVLANHAPI